MKKRPYQRGDLYLSQQTTPSAMKKRPYQRRDLSQQTTPSAMKSFLIRGATYLERDNTVAFYLLASSEIWPV
jgi:hypothetical protein